MIVQNEKWEVFTMAMIGYVARVLTGVRFKKMNHMIDVVHQKCGQNNVRTFFDMLWCAVRYGAGYYDYTMFGFYNMTGAQRDTYLTRVRNKKVSNLMNDMAHDDDFDDKLLFNVRFAKYLRRPTLNGETATVEQMAGFLEGQEAIFAKINHGSCGNGVEKLYVKDFESRRPCWTISGRRSWWCWSTSRPSIPIWRGCIPSP